MSAPTLSKSGVSTVTFTNGRAYPVVEPLEPIQVIGESDDGSVVVANLGNDIQYIDVSILGVPLSDVTALKAFLQDSLVNWSLNTFTWTDEGSSAYTVRYWGPFPLNPPRVAYGLYNIQFTLRVE